MDPIWESKLAKLNVIYFLRMYEWLTLRTVNEWYNVDVSFSTSS